LLLTLLPAFVTAGGAAGGGSGGEFTIYEGQPLRIEAVEAIVPSIEQALGIEITIVEAPNTGTDYTTKLITTFKGGEGYDIFRSTGEQDPDYIASGFPIDLTDRLEAWDEWNEQFYQSAKDFAREVGSGRIFGVPLHAGATSLWYRRDRLQEAGVSEDQPQTWTELVQKAIRVRDNSGAEYGLMLPMGNIWGGGPWGEGFKQFIYGSSTPYITDDQGRVVAQSQGLLEVFQLYESVVQNNLFQIDAMLAPLPHVIPKYQQFPAGVLAMETQGTHGWRFDYGPQGATPMPDIQEVVGTWAFPTAFGQGQPYIFGGYNFQYMIGSTTDDEDLAFEVLKHLVSAEQLGRYVLAVGSVSPRKDSGAAFPEYGANTALMKEAERLDSMVSFPPFEGESAVVLAVATATERLLLGFSAEEALAAYTNMIRQAFRRNEDGIVILPLD
jgi:multiple sugar transport system substrate-binding protein